ncbi:hypothetical protein CVT26_000240 [Gymnopilus dilepis]|uniref:WD40 repeat-like protein n=1 Tax=Gymnopilus dilepis TaxID=231916 RepID=A0A409VGB9_9AGAR|nr:hypothetical protein CVT26_000240 [Gymnopilus dilepis]
MAIYEDRISALSDELDDFMEGYEANSQRHNTTFIKEGFLDKLSGIIASVRDAQTASYSGLDGLTMQADHVLSNAIRWAYQNEPVAPYSDDGCMPSFAHEESVAPLLADERKEGEFSHGFTGSIGPELGTLLRIFGSSRTVAELKSFMKLPPPWKETFRPHPLSTACARFRDDIPEWTATEANNRATAVFEARCEISSGDINNPWFLRLSSNGNIVAAASMGGWKERTPYIHYFLPNHEQDPHGSFMKGHVIKADLDSGIEDLLLDDDRRLIFVADEDRIRSYRCNDPTVARSSAKRVHTMDSEGYTGPLAMLQNGRLIRAGKKAIAVWTLDTLQTHGESGKDIIGEEMAADDMDTWRDDPEDIEPSSGSAPSTTIPLRVTSSDDPYEFIISRWHQHPSQASVMLSGTDPMSQRFSCFGIDLEAGGSVTTRYLGHGGDVAGFSTSQTDPNVFLTWSNDGHARLFDVRHALPVLTIASSPDPEPLTAAVLAHPDGVPFVFVGTDDSQHIKLWDIRSRRSVYELATGNNSVAGLAWDAGNNTLYAATSCPYVDRLGRHTGYRRARIPRSTNVVEEDANEDDDEGSENEEEDDADMDYESEDDDICWPQRAHHAENYFGHVFDAGDHRFYKFSFKADPNPDILPHYGSGSLDRGDYW